MHIIIGSKFHYDNYGTWETEFKKWILKLSSGYNDCNINVFCTLLKGHLVRPVTDDHVKKVYNQPKLQRFGILSLNDDLVSYYERALMSEFIYQEDLFPTYASLTDQCQSSEGSFSNFYQKVTPLEIDLIRYNNGYRMWGKEVPEYCLYEICR